MYWPLGAPRVYVVNKSLQKFTQGPEEEEPQHDSIPEEATILGLQLCRTGHLFGTITQSGLTIWQTTVRQILCLFNWF